LQKYWRDYLFLFLIAGTVVFLDQWTKGLIRQNLAIGEVYRPDSVLSQFVRIVHWKNMGAAFGIFQQMGKIFMMLSFVVGAFIIFYFPRVPRQDWIVRLAMALLLGGAVGNLIDRLNQGYVTDYISILNFPVFNVADLSISTGVVILFLGMWRQEQVKKTSEPASLENQESLHSDRKLKAIPEEESGE